MMVVLPHNTQGSVFKVFFLCFMEAEQQIKWVIQCLPIKIILNANFYETELVKGVGRY